MATKCKKCNHAKSSHIHNAGVPYCDTCINKLNQFKWVQSEEKQWKASYHKYKEYRIWIAEQFTFKMKRINSWM